MKQEKIKVAMIGFGGIAKSHKKGYDILKAQGAPIELVAICDIDLEQFEKVQSINLAGGSKCDLSEQRLYTDIDEMLEKENIDMVDICLPSYLHCEYTVRMLRAGKHVLCEKPMALTSEDCQIMLDTARECGKKLMIGQCLRFEPLYLFIKDAIDNNTFGRVKNAFFERLSAMPTWGFDGWYRDTARSGGAILDLHIHDVDMVRFLFGEPKAVSSVSYDTDTKWTVINSRFIYDDGKIVVANASWDESNTSKFAMPYRINFEKATVILQNNSVVRVCPVDGEAYDAKLPDDDRMAEEIKALAMSIINGTENKQNLPESAMKTVELIEALRRSTAQGGANVAFS